MTLNRDEAVVLLVECASDYSKDLTKTLSLQMELLEALKSTSDAVAISQIFDAQLANMQAIYPRIKELNTFLAGIEKEYLKLTKIYKH